MSNSSVGVVSVLNLVRYSNKRNNKIPSYSDHDIIKKIYLILVKTKNVILLQNENKKNYNFDCKIMRYNNSIVLFHLLPASFDEDHIFGVMMTMMGKISQVSSVSAKNDFIVRGSIELGEIYFVDGKLNGRAFDKSFTLSRSLAKIARTIISSDILKYFNDKFSDKYKLVSKFMYLSHDCLTCILPSGEAVEDIKRLHSKSHAVDKYIYEEYINNIGPIGSEVWNFSIEMTNNYLSNISMASPNDKENFDDIVLYKFLDKNDLHFILKDNTLKFGSAKYYEENYTSMEVPDDWINDPNEGSITLEQNQVIFSGGPGPVNSNEARIRKILGIGTLQDNTIIGYNTYIMKIPNFHMLCLAYGDIHKLKKEFCEINIKRPSIKPYSACIEIFDPAGLIMELNNAFILIDGINYKFHEIFRHSRCSRVLYERTSYTWDEDAKKPSRFTKDAKFRDQNEFRLTFDISSDCIVNIPSSLIVKIPNINRYMREIEIS